MARLDPRVLRRRRLGRTLDGPRRGYGRNQEAASEKPTGVQARCRARDRPSGKPAPYMPRTDCPSAQATHLIGQAKLWGELEDAELTERLNIAICRRPCRQCVTGPMYLGFNSRRLLHDQPRPCRTNCKPRHRLAFLIMFGCPSNVATKKLYIKTFFYLRCGIEQLIPYMKWGDGMVESFGADGSQQTCFTLVPSPEA